jgi:hypothetical protein
MTDTSSATILANLKTRRANVAAELAAMSSAKAGGKPNSNGDGLSIDHVGYRESLLKEFKDLTETIGLLEIEASADAGDFGVYETQEWT